MKLYSSTFISIVLAFLMFLGYNSQPIDVAPNAASPDFTYIIKEEGPMLSEKIQIEIFDDLTCAGCTEFMKDTMPKIKDMEKETDEIDLHLYFIPDINNELFYQAAMSLKCAADQDQFWNMHSKLHENKNDLNNKSFVEFGKELELNTDAIRDCMEEEVHQKSIEEDIQYASEKNIAFKPTILVNNHRLIGNQPFENIQKAINQFIKKTPPVEAEPEDQTTDLKKEMEIPIPSFEINI